MNCHWSWHHAMKLTFGDYSFLGIDDMSVGRCMSHYENLNEGGKKSEVDA